MNDLDRFVFRVGSGTNVLGRPPVFFNSRDLIRAGCRFASVYAIREEDARAIAETAGTASGFRGVVWSRRLWIDFDNHDAAVRAEEFLKREGYDFVVYHTGGRGKHIGVLRAAEPSHTLPAQDKLWAATNTPGCDLGLYWHLHLIRLPGALHENTGLPKRLLYHHRGRELTLPPYVPDEAVSSGRTDLSPQATRRESIFKIWTVMSQVVEEPGGSRHRQLVAVAKALKEDAHVTFDEALWITAEVNRGFDEPKDIGEVERIVRWAYGLE